MLKKMQHPFFALDKSVCKENIQKMAEKACQSDVIFRPHFKTHQSIEISQWFREEGVEKICVSSLKMAMYFASAGWSDITIGMPVNINEADQLSELAKQVNLNILVSSVEASLHLVRKMMTPVNFYIEVDAGYHRSGIDSSNKAEISRILAGTIKSKLTFKGFLSHFGNTYRAASASEILSIYSESLNQLLNLKQHFLHDYPDLIISIGDTPSCSLTEKFDGVDEIRPGNFVFYDAMQLYLKSCSFNQIAGVLIAPVLEKNESKSELLIHGGAIHLSKEFLLQKGGEKIYGLVSKYKNRRWSYPIENAYVTSISQEHGIVKMPTKEFSTIKLGDELAIIPIHACLTANLMKEYVTQSGVIQMMS
ncbi:alanine racemase [Bacteroidota bacterium]